MSEFGSRSLEALRDDLRTAARTDDPAERALEVVAVIAEAVRPLGAMPVIVGGMAVYFWTADDAFLTYDIDVILETPEEVRSVLASLGFAVLEDRRHWRLEGTDILLEAPGATLDAGAVVTEVELRSGRSGRVISRVDILLDRLDEFQATGHRIAAQQVFVLLAQVTADDARELPQRAGDRRLTKVLAAMTDLAGQLREGRELPETDQLHEIARLALHAEYRSEAT